MSPDDDHTDYLQRLVVRLRKRCEEDDAVARRLVDHKESVLGLAMLDLFVVEDLLLDHYDTDSGGHPARDPVCMLRSQILMAWRGFTSFDRWVEHLEGHPEDAILTGFPADDHSDDAPPDDDPEEDDHNLPAVGTYYRFLDRLAEGPIDQRRGDVVSSVERRDGEGPSFVRHLKADRDDVDEDSPAERLADDDHDTSGTVHRRVEEALERLDEAIEDDWTKRLNQILMEVAVVPSAHKGLIEDLETMIAAADGTALETQASGRGHPTCECDGDCDHPRRYSDPDAEWGWDAHDETYVFGHRLHAHSTSTTLGREIPLHLSVTSAEVPDVVRAVDDDVRLATWVARKLPDEASIRDSVRDAGYDARAYYKLLNTLGHRPIIPYAQEPQVPLESREGFRLDDTGTPLCPGDKPMTRNHANAVETVYHCPAKYATHEDGEYVRKTDPARCPLDELCEPDSQMGPIVRMPFEEDHRIHVPLPRDSDRWNELYDTRSGVERLFSRYKGRFGLGDRPFRRQRRFHMHATLAGIVMHAECWVEARFGDDSIEDAEDLLEALEQLADEWTARAEVRDAA